ncbi:rRNA methyltransferase 1, mitochondrial-like isoform X2 [Asterias amurensis]|uniref:rRNA methyltransferase 1, mitochondrial-like isoform X2 n=1 Tax=Asterias amurensis TaxID=7602 RepID=UPI003AB6F1A7
MRMASACTRLSCVVNSACKQLTILPIARGLLETPVKGKTRVACGVRTNTSWPFPEGNISINTKIIDKTNSKQELRRNISNVGSSSDNCLTVGNGKLLQCAKKAALWMNMTCNQSDQHNTNGTSSPQVQSQPATCASDNNLHVSGDLLINNTRQAEDQNQSRFVSKPARKLVRGLDPRTGVVIDILYGISPCLLALERKRRTVHKVFMSSSFIRSTRPEVRQIIDKIKEEELSDVVQETQRANLDQITRGRPHQGICLETSRIYFQTLPEDSTETKQSQVQPVHLVLDQIKDPMNLGAILRSAYYLGVDRVIASRHNCCSLTPVVSKASSGVMEIMPVYATTDVLSFLQKQRENGWEIVGSTSVSSHNVSRRGSKIAATEDFTVCKPTTLVIGSEGSGLSAGVEDLCNVLLTIPAGRILHSGIDSLNVSVATGILLQSLLQGRR